MAKLRVKWVKSAIGYSKDQKATIRALGLRKLQQTVEHEDNPAMRGMIRKVNHLVKVEEVVSCNFLICGQPLVRTSVRSELVVDTALGVARLLAVAQKARRLALAAQYIEHLMAVRRVFQRGCRSCVVLATKI